MNGLQLFKRPSAAEDELLTLQRRREELRAQEEELERARMFLERKDRTGRVYMLPTGSISPNRAQPRTCFDETAILRLADSIRIHGILQPLVVRLLDDSPDEGFLEKTAELDDAENLSIHAPDKQAAGSERQRPASMPEPAESSKDIPAWRDETPKRYEIIAGERRFRAAKLLGMQEIPCLLIEADDKRSAELAIIENLQRENLNIFEQAAAIAALIDMYGMTQEQLARQLSSSQSYVANKLRILRLNQEERDIILKSGLTERHARALLKIDDPALRMTALRHIAGRNLNVAASEDYIERLLCARSDPEGARAKRKLILKDIRLFYNTIDRAVDIVKQAGITVISDRREVGEGVELVIRIPNPYRAG